MRLYTQAGHGSVSAAWPALLPSLVSRALATCVCPGRTRVLAASEVALRWTLEGFCWAACQGPVGQGCPLQAISGTVHQQR